MKPLDPRLVRRSRGVRRLLGIVVVLGVAGVAAIIAQASLIAAVVVQLFDGEVLLTSCLAIAGCFAARAALHWVQSVVAGRAAATVKAELRTELADDLLDPRRVGPAPHSAAVGALLGPGFDAFDGYISRFLPQVVMASLLPPVIVTVMVVIDPVSGLIVAITLPLAVVFMVLVGMLTRDKLNQRWEALERLSHHFAEVLEGLVVLKLFGQRQERGLREIGDRHRRETLRSLRLAFLSSLVLELVATLSVALVAVSVGLRVVDGSLDLQPALLVLLLAPEAFLPIRSVGAMFHDSTAGAEAVAAALALLDHERHTGRSTAPDLSTTDLIFDHVLVTHPERNLPALTLRSETIRPGEFIAVTGPSGSGKSTLLDVLLAFVRPTGGRVDAGGISISDVDPEAWRRQIAWVPQLPGLIEGTIAANVRMANTHATDAEVAAALRGAGADDLAPGRWVSESGKDLSAGERRRIAIARALLRVRTENVNLVLLDEPTAGFDAAREAAVLDVLRTLKVTIIVVAHRPETVAAADRVIDVQPADVVAA